MRGSSAARSQLSSILADMGKWIGIGTFGWGTLIWIAGAILIAVGAEVSHHTGHSGLINTTRFNLLFILGCGIAGFVIQSRISWRSREVVIRRLLAEIRAKDGYVGVGPSAAAAGGTIVGLAAGAGAIGLVIFWIIVWVTSIMLIPLILAFGFFVFLY